MTFAGRFCMLLLLLYGSLNVNATMKPNRVLTNIEIESNNFLQCLRPHDWDKQKSELVLTLPVECESLLDKLAYTWLDRPMLKDKDKPKKSLWKRWFCKE
ncbi:uncharacterized protein DMAD_07719 [Drosophila madeirensis]|uniref:Uncharacterized protein n=1 Tax=Drosophila madeirensis TaxID=30013 RepID=A0AAU9F044_DROMD